MARTLRSIRALPHHSQPPSTQSTAPNHSNFQQLSDEQELSFCTPGYSPEMAPAVLSSPLSNPPSSPRIATTQKPAQASSGTTEKACNHHSEAKSTPISPIKAVSQDDALVPLTVVPTPKEQSPTPSMKRGREDGNEEGSPPSKKAATELCKQPASKTKEPPSKPTTRKPAAKRAPAKKRTAATPAPSAPSRRPARARKAPERFEDHVQAPVPKPAPAPKAATKVFDPTYITTNSSSRLVKADLFHLLLETQAWDCLNAAQQEELISMLPKHSVNDALLEKLRGGTEGVPRPKILTVSNDCFRTDVAKFKADLKNGHLAKTWQAAAHQAVIARAAGEYDAWKAEEAEDWWGQKGNGPS